MAGKNEKTLKRKIFEAGSWKLVRRIGRSVPYVGTALSVGMVGYDIKKKGVVKGILNSGIDAIPFVGLAKNTVEYFTGDIFPDKQPEPKYVRSGEREKNKNGEKS